MRIGLFGGSFNPIHNGHLALARGAKRQLNLDRVIFIPAYIPPHKSPEELIDAQDRLNIVSLAIEAEPGFEVSSYEIDKKGKSYSVDTVRHFKANCAQDTELFFLIGADSLEELNTWKDADEILKLSYFGVCARPGFSIDKTSERIHEFTITPVDISSTRIRKDIRGGKGVSGSLPPPVEEYIGKKNLYK